MGRHVPSGYEAYAADTGKGRGGEGDGVVVVGRGETGVDPGVRVGEQVRGRKGEGHVLGDERRVGVFTHGGGVLRMP